jgi:hypothetical protein
MAAGCLLLPPKQWNYLRPMLAVLAYTILFYLFHCICLLAGHFIRYKKMDTFTFIFDINNSTIQRPSNFMRQESILCPFLTAPLPEESN